MAIPLAVPAFLVPIAAWLADQFTRRGWRVASAIFFMSATVAVIALVIAAVSQILLAMPAPVSAGLMLIGPVDWAAQVSAVITIKAIGMAYQVWKTAYLMASA